jgi:hypothetical protein
MATNRRLQQTPNLLSKKQQDYLSSLQTLISAPSRSTSVTGATLSTNTFTGLNTFSAGISSTTGAFSGNISAQNMVNSVNGLTGAVQYIADFKRGWFFS